MSSLKNWLLSKRHADPKTQQLSEDPSSSEHIVPVSLTMSNNTMSTLESRGYSFTSDAPTLSSSSSSSGVAEMMDEDNTAWGASK